MLLLLVPVNDCAFFCNVLEFLKLITIDSLFYSHQYCCDIILFPSFLVLIFDHGVTSICTSHNTSDAVHNRYINTMGNEIVTSNNYNDNDSNITIYAHNNNDDH